MSEVHRALARMKESREWDRVNPDNQVCPGGCNRRERPDWLDNIVRGVGVCAECADDETARVTGCRLGLPDDCTSMQHPDCHE